MFVASYRELPRKKISFQRSRDLSLLLVHHMVLRINVKLESSFCVIREDGNEEVREGKF